MFSNGRMVAVTLVSLGVGFVGGVWFISSGLGFDLFPLPTVPAANAMPAASTPKRVTPPPVPRVKAVEVPWPANFSGSSGGLGLRADRIDLAPAPGCDWEIDPRTFAFSSSWTKTNRERALCGYSAAQVSTGALLYFFVQSTSRGAAALELRPVFFDKEGTRYVPLGHTSKSGSLEGQLLTSEFTLDPVAQLPRDKVAYFGIERVAPNAERLLADAAHKTAEEKGIAILPIPQVGKPYAFDLTTADGRRIRTEDFRDKAVVIWVWGPSLSDNWLQIDLKRIRDSYIDNEIVFVGVSFDGSVEEAREKFAKGKTDGSLVFIANDAKTRRLWQEGAQITRLPAYFLIDRDGILRHRGNFFDFKQNVDILFGRYTPFQIHRPKFGPPRLPPLTKGITPPSQPAATKKAPGRTPGS